MHHTFSNPSIAIATPDDAPALVSLLNRAYRGEVSKQGWTTEANLIAGDTRADMETVQTVIEEPDSIMLKYTNDAGKIIGCVNLQQHDTKLYLGMFSVSPQLQGGGIGKQILKAADEYAEQAGCYCIYMTVISARSELIAWYVRHGYKDTGERKPFVEDGLTGAHLQKLEFMVLEKILQK